VQQVIVFDDNFLTDFTCSIIIYWLLCTLSFHLVLCVQLLQYLDILLNVYSKNLKKYISMVLIMKCLKRLCFISTFWFTLLRYVLLYGHVLLIISRLCCFILHLRWHALWWTYVNWTVFVKMLCLAWALRVGVLSDQVHSQLYFVLNSIT